MVEARLADLKDLHPDAVHRTDFFGRSVILWRVDDRPVAAIDACTHTGGPLELREGSLVCQWHRACFEREQGFARCGPADEGSRLTLLPLEVRADGSVWFVFGQPPTPGATAFPLVPRAHVERVV